MVVVVERRGTDGSQRRVDDGRDDRRLRRLQNARLRHLEELSIWLDLDHLFGTRRL